MKSAANSPYDPMIDPVGHATGQAVEDGIKGLGLGSLAGLAVKGMRDGQQAAQGVRVRPGGSLKAMGAGAAIGGALGVLSGVNRSSRERDLLMAQTGLKFASLIEQAYETGREFAREQIAKDATLAEALKSVPRQVRRARQIYDLGWRHGHRAPSGGGQTLAVAAGAGGLGGAALGYLAGRSSP